MKKSPKKLTLSRETLRNLTREQAKAVLGGDYTTLWNCPPPPPTSDSKNVCCVEE